MAKLTVAPLNIELEVDRDTDLLTVFKQNEINVKNSCGGCASCSHCVIVIKEGAENLNEISFEEKQVLGNIFHITSERLSCQTKITGDVTVDISAHGHTETKTKAKPVLRKKDEVDKIREERIANRKEKPKRLGGGKKPKAFKFDPDAKPKYTDEDKGE